MRSAKQITAIAGSIALALGCFLPLIHLPILGGITYSNYDSQNGTIVIIMAFVALICALIRPAVIVSSIMGWLSAGIVGYTFYHVVQRVSNVKASAGDNPIAQLFTHSLQLGIAWPFLFGGAIALIVSGFLPKEK